MSTRCTIRLYDQRGNVTAQYYKHHDGYPDGVGEFLKRALALTAHGFRLSDHITTAEALEKLLEIYPKFEKEAPDIFHCDIEYYYPILLFDNTSRAYIKTFPTSSMESEKLKTLLNIFPFEL